MKVSDKRVTRRKAQKSTGFTTAQNGTRPDGRSQRLSESESNNARTSKKDWKWHRGIVTHPLSESQCNRGHFSIKKWKSEKHKSWSMQAEGFKGHVARDGSLLGTAGK